MSYKFKLDESVHKGFRRIAGEQLESALTELAGPEVVAANVHECRKSLKRLRALLRLSAGAIGSKAQRHNKALAGIAKLLSERRDQTVMLDTIAKLSHQSADDAAALSPLKDSLAAQDGAQGERLGPDVAEQARGLLAGEARKLARIKLGKRGFAALAGGLEASYRHGRKALKRAYGEPSDENFHELRKAVQWHWRQMALLSKAWPDEFDARANAARELSQHFGDDHDLAILAHSASQSASMSEEQKAAAIEVCRRHQQMLRAAAEFGARRLFTEKPGAFVGRIAAYWRYGHQLESQLEVPAEPGQLGTAGQVKAAAESADAPPKERRPAKAKPRLAAQSETPVPSQRRA